MTVKKSTKITSYGGWKKTSTDISHDGPKMQAYQSNGLNGKMSKKFFDPSNLRLCTRARWEKLSRQSGMPHIFFNVFFNSKHNL